MPEQEAMDSEGCSMGRAGLSLSGVELFLIFHVFVDLILGEFSESRDIWVSNLFL
jgi:hypothetical protein